MDMVARAAGSGGTQDAPAGARRKLLVIDTTNTLELIRSRGTEDSVTCRDLGGFFEHVWSVHPLATLTTSAAWTSPEGPPISYEVAPRHTFVEGKVGRFPALRRFFLLNFAIAQAGLLIRLYRLIRREKISVIRAGDPLYTGILSWLLARLTGIPFAVRVGGNHDKYYETTGQLIMPRLFRKRKYEKMAERFVFRRADLVAAANGDYVDFSVENGADPAKVTIFPYGNLIDRRHFQDPAEREFNPSRFTELDIEPGKFLISIGRLEAVKRPDEMVRLLALLRERGRNLKLVLVGEGTMHESLTELARELGVADRVVLAGNRSQAWLADVTPHAASVVAPIAGRALTEAALGAPPVAAYDIDWHKELIETGETGELVGYRDWRSMADSIERFLDDPAYARRMGQAVRARALRMLDHEKLDEHEREEYRLLFQRFRPRGQGLARSTVSERP